MCVCVLLLLGYMVREKDLDEKTNITFTVIVAHSVNLDISFREADVFWKVAY